MTVNIGGPAGVVVYTRPAGESRTKKKMVNIEPAGENCHEHQDNCMGGGDRKGAAKSMAKSEKDEI